MSPATGSIEQGGKVGPIDALTPLARPGDWHAWLRATSLLIASLLTLAAITCFIAYNWQDMSRVARIAVVGLGLLGSAGLALAAGPVSPARGPLLLLTFGVLGILFALVGQVYQLGADSFGLYLTWAVYALPLVVVGRAQIVWAAWLVVLWFGLFFMQRQAPELVEGFWAYVVDPWVVILLGAALVLALRQALLDRLDWLRPSLLPGLLALVAVVPWFINFWLLMWPNTLVEIAPSWRYWLLWFAASMTLAGSLLISAFWRGEALLTFVGVFWVAGAVAAIGFRIILSGAPNTLPDGIWYYFLFGMVILWCFIGAAAVMRRWLKVYGPEKTLESGLVKGIVEGANHWSVTVLRAIGGLVGGLLISMALLLLAGAAWGTLPLAAMGLIIASLCLYVSYRTGLKDPTSQSGTHALVFVLYLSGLGFLVNWISYNFDLAGDFLSPAFYLLRFVVLGSFLASVPCKVWRPGQVLLLIATLIAFVPELFRIMSIEQAGLFLVVLVAVGHFARPRWTSWRYLHWGLLVVTLIYLEALMLAWGRGILPGSSMSFLGFAQSTTSFWQQRFLIVVVLVGLALLAAYERQRQGRDGWRLLPYAGLMILATIALPLLCIFAVMLMLGGRHRENLVMEIMGWLTLLVSLNQWYMALAGSLLLKSGYLAISAAVMWGIFVVLTWIMRPPEAGAAPQQQEGTI